MCSRLKVTLSITIGRLCYEMGFEDIVGYLIHTQKEIQNFKIFFVRPCAVKLDFFLRDHLFLILYLNRSIFFSSHFDFTIMVLNTKLTER